MVALPREATYRMIALAVVIVIGTLTGFLYAKSQSVRDVVPRFSARHRGARQNLGLTELLFQSKRDKLIVATCITAYISTAPSSYIRKLQLAVGVLASRSEFGGAARHRWQRAKVH